MHLVSVWNHGECHGDTVILLEASKYMFKFIIDRISESHSDFDKSYSLELQQNDSATVILRTVKLTANQNVH